MGKESAAAAVASKHDAEAEAHAFDKAKSPKVALAQSLGVPLKEAAFLGNTQAAKELSDDDESEAKAATVHTQELEELSPESEFEMLLARRPALDHEQDELSSQYSDAA